MCGGSRPMGRVRALPMLLRIWTFFRDKKNREIVSWFGAGLFALAAGVWALFVYFFPHHEKPGAPTTTTVTQPGTGIASGGNTIVNAPVNIGVDEKKIGQQITDAQKPLTD